MEFGEYVIDIAPYQRVGLYASDLIFEILLKSMRYMTKTNAEAHYETLIGPVNQNMMKVTHIEIQKILVAMELIDIKENP